MHFAQIYMAVWGSAVFALWALLSWAQRHRAKALRRFSEDKLLAITAASVDERKYRRKNWLLIATAAFSVLALMRPQWGFEWKEVKRQGIDIIVVVDTSKSMLTQDVKPNRLKRTKFAVQDLLKKLKGDRIGLVAFSGDAFLICPLTVDYGGFQISLNDLDVETVPRGGTNVEKAIDEAIKDYDKSVSSKNKAIIIITDGDNLEGDPVAAARKAKEKGIKVYTIGIGSAEGELIQIRNEHGEMVFLKDDQGNFVKSRLNEALLKEIALITGGVYVKASGSKFGLDLIYEQELSKFEKREIAAKMEKKYHERFQFPLAVAALLLVIETCLTAQKKTLPEQ